MYKSSKLVGLVCLFAICLIPNVLSAQQNDEPEIKRYGKKNLLKLNLVSPILSSLAFSYERVLSADQSFQLNLFVQSSDRYYWYDEEQLTGFGITPELRFYLSEKKEAPGGFFIAPFLQYRHFNAKYVSDDWNGTAYKYKSQFDGIGLGVTVGAQWVFKKRVSLDIWGGTGYGLGFVKEDNPNPQDEYFYSYFDEFPFLDGGGVIARGGVAVGFLF